MFRCLAQCRNINFQIPSASFHSSASAWSLKSKRRKQREAELQLEASKRPSPVLGTKLGDEKKWHDCELSQILVNERDFRNSTELISTSPPIGQVGLPRQLAFGVSSTETEALFGDLPELSVQTDLLGVQNPEELERHHSASRQRELLKANIFARLLDLRNADAGGIAYENRRRIILAFSTPQRPFDTGRTEVQAALLTYRIRNLWAHRQKSPRDVGNKLGLRKLVHHRARLLKYLRRTDRVRYDILLERIGVEPESVEGELIV